MRNPNSVKFAHLALWLLAFVLGAGSAVADSAALSPTNTMCPVMPDEEVDPEISVEYEGQRVYFCCNRCRKQFLEAPAEYLGNLPQFAALAFGESEHEHDHKDTGAPAIQPARGHEEDEGHDHAVGHGEPEGIWRFVRFLGKLHPVAVHFPIALVLAALLAEALSMATRKPLFTEGARFSVVLATLSGAVTVGLGWAAGAFAHYPADLSQTLWLHRWLGTGTGVLVILSAVLSELARLPDRKRPFLLAYRTLLFIASIAVGLTGHFGATLIYGFNYFSW